MNKKQLLSLSILGVLFLIFAVLFGIIIHSGANHPPLRFPTIGDVTSRFINTTSQEDHKDACISQVSQGPFKWDNEKDLGCNTKLGTWSRESDHDAVIYYKRDKDAQWQAKAQAVLFDFDTIAEELSALMGRDCFASDSTNGRKFPIYLPETEQEYYQVLETLCDGKRAPNNKVGSSVINIGPLGCKSEGIVIHPDAFKNPQECEYVLRKEMARYAYLSSVDYNEDIDHQAWFMAGLIEMFAEGPADESAPDSVDQPNGTDVFSNEIVDLIDKSFNLTSVLTGALGAGPQIGISFLSFFVSSQGDGSLTNLIQESFTGSLEDAFSDMGLDFEQVKGDWVNTLRGAAGEVLQ